MILPTKSAAGTEEVFLLHPDATADALLWDHSETPPMACQAACAARPDCAGYVAALGDQCQLFAAVTDNPLADPFAPATEGVWVRRRVDRAAEALARRQELALLGPAPLAAADRMRAGLPPPLVGESFDSLFYGPYPQSVEDMFPRADISGDEGLAWATDAFAKTRMALAQTTDSGDWLVAAGTMLEAAVWMTELGIDGQRDLTLAVYDAAQDAAVTACLLALDEDQQQAALHLLTLALFANDRPDLARKTHDVWAALVHAPEPEASWAAISGAADADPPLTRKDVQAPD